MESWFALAERRSAEQQQVVTNSAGAIAAQREALDRILSNHLLYCTICDNNNGNCTVHNTTKMLAIDHQQIPFRPKPYPVDDTNPFYRYDPSQCILCGRCVEACQNVQVNETLSIRWEDAHPRVLWDGGAAIGESSCVSCGHCITVCPCNALMEKSMLGHAGFFTSLPQPTLEGMIDVVKSLEPETGYGPVLGLSDAEAAMRDSRVRRTKTVCTYCGVGCSFDDVDQGSPHFEGRAVAWPGKRDFHLRQRQICMGLRECPGPPDPAPDPRGRQIPRSYLDGGARPGRPQVSRNQGQERVRCAGVYRLFEVHQ